MRLRNFRQLSLLLTAICALPDVDKCQAYRPSVISQSEEFFTSNNKSASIEPKNINNTRLVIYEGHSGGYPAREIYHGRLANPIKHHGYTPSLNTTSQKQQLNQRLDINDNNNVRLNNVDFIDGKQSDDRQITRNGDTRIPFWNIAHMVNSIEQVDYMLG